MKVTGEVPQWAIDLVEQVCKDYNRTTPGELKWKPSPHKWTDGSSGSCSYDKRHDGGRIEKYHILKSGKGKWRPFYGRILIRFGSDVKDQRLVLLHELAHWISFRSKRGRGHTVHFWKKAFELYRDYGVDLGYAHEREKHYRKTAVTVYERFYL